MSARSHLYLLVSVVRSAERLCEGELRCLGHWRKVSALCLPYRIYHGAGHSIHGYLHHFVVARASAAQGELALMVIRYITDQFSRTFLPALWNFLPSGVFIDVTPWALSLIALWTYASWELSLIFSFFISVSFCCSIAYLISGCWIYSGL